MFVSKFMYDMRRRIIVMIFAVFLTATVCARQRPYMVFWNLENYFDPFDDSLTVDEEFTPGGYRHWTWSKFLDKRNLIAKALLSMHDRYGDFPVLAAFAEVENRMVLRQLVERTPLAKLGYGIVHRDSPDRRGIDVALIYRQDSFRVLDVRTSGVLTGGDRPTRDILYVAGVLTWTGDTVHVFVNHWPSKFGGDEYTRPFRQAASDTLARAVLALRDSLTGKLPSVIVTGDFNDTPDSPPALSLASGTGLVNLAFDLHERGEGSLKYNGRWELIDHFLVSGALEGSVMEIYSHPMLLEDDSKFLGVKPRRSYYGPMWHGGASDHLPIVLLLPSISQTSDRYD